jgi:RNA polymerase subunit RPABC4/transcription elongation factor Spt4
MLKPSHVMRDGDAVRKQCAACGAQAKAGRQYCFMCGTQFLPSELLAESTTADQGQPVCSECGAVLREGARFCPGCGLPVVEDNAVTGPLVCPECSTTAQDDDRFCTGCGREIERAATARHATPVPRAGVAVQTTPSKPAAVPSVVSPPTLPAVASRRPPQDKSVGAALVLTLFFGPFGLLYSVAWWSALLMLVGSVIAGLLTFFIFGAGAGLFWAASMVWGAVAASNKHSKYCAWLAAQPQTFVPQPPTA